MHVYYCAVDTYTTGTPLQVFLRKLFPGNTPVPCHVISAPGGAIGRIYPIECVLKSNSDFIADTMSLVIDLPVVIEQSGPDPPPP